MRPKSFICAIAAALASVVVTSAAQQPPDPDTRQFVNDMAVAGLAEVQLGKLAELKASSPDVKAFGQMMVRDHSQPNAELKRIASQIGVTPPADLDAKHKDLLDRLAKLEGAEFDREYINAMVQGHEVLTKLKSRAERRMTSTQPGAAAPKSGAESVGTAGKGEQALNQWAAKTLPVVQKHLERAQVLQKKLK
jgi:putative membrane protein